MKPGIALALALLGLGLASGASAAVSVNLSASADGSCAEDLGPGCQITLTVRVTADAGEMDNAVFGALNIENSKIDPGVRVQNALPNGPWNLGALNCTTVFCVLFSQVRPAGPAAVNVTNFLIATATFWVEIDEPLGSVIHFSWRTSPTTQRLDFFGITNAPGLTLTVGGPVPEPATAALLGVGLMGLALARRRPRA